MNGESKIIPISQFLSLDMTDNVIIAMILNSIPDSHLVRIYKVNKRNQVRVLSPVNIYLKFLIQHTSVNYGLPGSFVQSVKISFPT